MKKRILIMGAFQPEINTLFENLNGRVIAGHLIQNKDISDMDDFLIDIKECGIGGLRAALSFQSELLDRESPPVVEAIFTGTAGIYKGKISADELTGKPAMITGFSSLFYKYETSNIMGESKIPPGICVQVQSSVGPLAKYLKEQLTPMEGASNSPDSITLSRAHSELLKDSEALFENMEAFALSFAADVYHVPFSAFYAITNRVGSEGSTDWEKNHKIYSNNLQVQMIKYLRHFLAE